MSSGSVLQKGYPEKFLKTHGKAIIPEPLLKNVPNLPSSQSCNLISQSPSSDLSTLTFLSAYVTNVV